MWGSETWGQMIWGGEVAVIPALGPSTLVLLGALIVIAAVAALRRAYVSR